MKDDSCMGARSDELQCVFIAIVDVLSNMEIAERFGLTEGTVLWCLLQMQVVLKPLLC